MSTHNIQFQYKKDLTLNYPKSAAMGFFSKGLMNDFERAVVNDPPVFEPLKLDCNSFLVCLRQGCTNCCVKLIVNATCISRIHNQRCERSTATAEYKKDNSVFLCPRDDSQGTLRFAPVCLSVCLSVRSSRFTV